MPKLKSRFATIFLILFLFTAYGLGPIAQSLFADDSKEEEALFVAQRAFDDGFYDVSFGLLERFLKSYPDSTKNSHVQLLIGECYFHQNKFLEALTKFEDLQNLPQARDIKDAVLYWIAEVHFKGNDFGKAAEYYKMIVDGYPKSTYLAPAYYSLGWCLFQEQKYTTALEYFRIIEEKYSKAPQVQDYAFKIIECLYNLKSYAALKEKIKTYLKVYAKDNFRLSYLYFYLAEADYYLNNFNDAINEYSKVISGSQDEKIQALSKLGVGWSYLKLKLYKEAEDIFRDIKEADLEKKSLDILYLGRAILMTESGRINEARNIYDQLATLTQDPLVLMQAYIGTADALYNLADYLGAINTYKEALSKAPSDLPPEIIDKLHYGLAWSFLKQGEFKDAIQEFQKVAKESEDKIVQVSALCQIGDAYQDSGDYNKAQETYDSILKNYPDSSYNDYVQYQLGMTLLKASNYDGAILSFQALKKNFPSSKLLDDASYALGLAYFQRQDYNSSRELFEKFQQEFKDSNLRPGALYLLGTSFYNLGDFPEAIQVFKEVARNFNQDTELVQKAEYEIADCYYQMGNEKEAMSRFKSLRSKYPDSGFTAEVMWWLGEYYYRHNDLELARRYFSSLIQDFPKSNLVADAYYALASSYEDEGKFEEAISNFKEVISLGRSDLIGQAAVAIADIYAKQDKADMALGTYKDIISDYPNLVSLVYIKIADLLFKTGNYAQALDYYRKSLELVPVREMPDVQFKIGEALDAQGKYQEAIEEYMKVTYLYSENKALAVKALLRVAQIYENRQNLKEAMNIYKRIVSLNVEEAKYAQERIDWIKTQIK